MADQRFRNLESGGSVRITEAVMRGSGPQGPKGDRGPAGPATHIKGRIRYNALMVMKGEPGDAWIVEEPAPITNNEGEPVDVDGHLFVWDQYLYENWPPDQQPTQGFAWVDCGKIVGPPGTPQSLGAQLFSNLGQGNLTLQAGASGKIVFFTTVDYNDNERITDASGEWVADLPLISLSATTPYEWWSYSDRSRAEALYTDDPVHMINVDVVMTALPNLNQEGSVTLRLWRKKPDEYDDNGTLVKQYEWEATGITAKEYFETNNATSPSQTANITWVGKTAPGELFQVRVSSGIDGYINLARMQTARVGGVAGPPGPKGDRGPQGEQGQQGIRGPEGKGAVPPGAVFAFAGHPLWLEGNYKTKREDDGYGNIRDVPDLTPDGKRQPADVPSYLPCDGSPVHQETRLFTELGMKNTPDLRKRFIYGAVNPDAVPRPDETPGGDLMNYHSPWENKNPDNEWYGGSNKLVWDQVPRHTHTSTTKGSISDYVGSTPEKDLNHNHGGSVDGAGKHNHWIRHKHKFSQLIPNNKTVIAKNNDQEGDGHSPKNVSGHLFWTGYDAGGWTEIGQQLTNSNYSDWDSWTDQSYTGTSPFTGDGDGTHSHSLTINNSTGLNNISFDLGHGHSLKDLEVAIDYSHELAQPKDHTHEHVVMMYVIKT